MGTLLFIPLTLIAFFESTLNTSTHQRLKHYFSGDVVDDEDDPQLQDPETEGEEGQICTEKFADLIKAFPKYVQENLPNRQLAHRIPVIAAPEFHRLPRSHRKWQNYRSRLPS